MSKSNKKAKILKSKPAIAIIAVIIVAALTAAAFLIVKSIKEKEQKEKIAEYLSQNLEIYGELNIISDTAEVDGETNTLAGIKEAHRLGADTVTLDLCFNSDDIPVICDDYDNITDKSLKLENVFKLLNEKKYSALRINLRIRQLGSLSKFNELMTKYKMSGRVLLSGIDKERYGLISGENTSALVFFDYTPQKGAKDSLNEINNLIKNYGITGVIIEYDNVTKELAEILNERGIKFIAANADEELDMYAAIGSGASNIETSSPEKLREVYDLWKTTTDDRMNQSIIDELK